MWAPRFQKVASRAFQPYRRPAQRPSAFNFTQNTSFFQQRAYNNWRYQRFQQGTNIFKRWAARPTFYYEVGGLGAVGGGVYIANLETVPVSGRRRFNCVSPETEKSMADGALRQVLQQYGRQVLPDHDRRVQLVRRVLERLIPVSGVADADWEVYVIDSEEANAFVIPGGKVFVFTGILPICKDEDGVAAVLGHEIAHNVAHHSGERMSRGIFLFAGVWGLEFIFGIPEALSSSLLQVLFFLPHGRTQETEADYIGLLMMAKACYDPNAALRLWQIMEQRDQSRAPPEFISTHPSSFNRQGKIREWLPEAQAKRDESECGSMIGYAQDFRQVSRGWS